MREENKNEGDAIKGEQQTSVREIKGNKEETEEIQEKWVGN